MILYKLFWNSIFFPFIHVESVDADGVTRAKYTRFAGFFFIEKGLIASCAHGFAKPDPSAEGKFKLLKFWIWSIGKKLFNLFELEVTPVAVNLSTDLSLIKIPPNLLGMEEAGVLPLGGETQVGKSVMILSHPIYMSYSPQFGRVVSDRKMFSECSAIGIPDLKFVPQDSYTIVVDSNARGVLQGAGDRHTGQGKVISVLQSRLVVDHSYVSFSVPVYFLRDLIDWYEKKVATRTPGIFVNG